MTITRAGLADEIDGFDLQIKALNEAKSEAYKAYRVQLEEHGMEPRRASAEVSATKAAIAKRRKLRENPDEAREKDHLVDDILDEIMPEVSRAREALLDELNSSVEGHDPETGEITEGDAQYAHPSTEPQVAPQPAHLEPLDQSATDPLGSGSATRKDAGPEAPVPHSPETAERGAGPETAPASGDDAVPPTASSSTHSQSSDLHDGRLQAVSAPALDESGAGAAGVEAPAASVIPFHPEETREQRTLRMRPHCQRPSGWGASGPGHCHSCTKAMQDTGPEAA